MSASFRMIIESHPPSSRDTGVRLSAAERIMLMPVSVPPVNMILLTEEDCTNALPIPEPWMQMTRSSGNPAFLNSDDINSPQRGVSDEGLSMTEFPTATD